jgi:serine/threonine-protein kinase RsbW
LPAGPGRSTLYSSLVPPEELPAEGHDFLLGRHVMLAQGTQVCWVHSVADTGPLITAVCQAMEAVGYPEGDVLAVRLALWEALVNAIDHGNGGDPAKRVRVSYLVMQGVVLAEVEDEGPGFDPAQVPDPRDPENLERFGGRGLLLMRHCMDSVTHNDLGNRVTLCKYRSGR